MIFAFTIVALFYAGPVSSAIVNVNFSGIITNVNNYGGLPASPTITQGTSTFSGQFSYDTVTSGTLKGGAMYYYPNEAFTVTIDGSITFQAPSFTIYVSNAPTDEIRISNWDMVSTPSYSESFYESVELVLNDNTGTALASQDYLPSSINLDDWGSLRNVTFYGFTDGYSSNPWSIAGQINAINTVPIPGAVCLLGSGLIGILGVRRKFKK